MLSGLTKDQQRKDYGMQHGKSIGHARTASGKNEEKFHSNIWLVQSAADLILDEKERNERLLSSKSYKPGSRVVNATRKMLSLLTGAHRA